MKKTLLSLIALGMSVLGANAATEYTVEEYIAACANGALGTEVVVNGYIVGWVDGSYLSGATFTSDATSATNLLLADSTSEDDYTYCVPVQLPTGTIRSALNLQDNPQNFHHQVKLTGTSEKYFGVNAGLKTVTAYEWVGDAPVADTTGFATGSETAPLTVTEFLAQGTPSAAVENTYVKGYIVGYVDGMSISGAVFNATDATSATNILIAAAADETNVDNCVPVQLPSGELRSALNLQDNPGNLGKVVTLCGSHEKYFGVNGLKSIVWYNLDGTEGGETPGETTTDDAIYSGLVSNGDDWTIEYPTLPEGLNYVWIWDDSYGMKASAYYNSTSYTTDAWVISPVVDLTGYTDVTVSCQQAANYCSGQVADFLFGKVREENGTWEDLEYSNMPAGSAWTYFSTTADASAYDGKKVQFAFEYTSNDSVAATWEIKNFTVTGVSESGVEEVLVGNEVYVQGNNIVAPEGARVYNLNGVQTGTANLASGVYVVVVANKAVKVLVK